MAYLHVNRWISLTRAQYLCAMDYFCMIFKCIWAAGLGILSVLQL